MSHVCFVWRVTARSTPKLWTDYVDRSLKRNLTVFAAVVPEYLRCSAALPIMVDIDLESCSPEQVSTFIKTLVPLCSRWNSPTLPHKQMLEFNLACIGEPSPSSPVDITRLPLAILKGFSNVIVLILSFPEFKFETLKLQALTSPVLSTTYNGCSAFMDPMTAPNLIAFKPSQSGGRSHPRPRSLSEHFSAFQQRCNPPIKELTSSQVDTMLMNELIALLTLFLYLRNSNFSGAGESMGALEFNGLVDITSLVPKLTCFGFCESPLYVDDVNE
ncbi:hypothetical protein BDP27DRAFT_1418461 [Rhodocollybia butyracea]|uniref:F-box domain-containing protein n=1 Tax=Rhodocollybia butyracea TaxID=206335 RepID=A0A9P5UAK8_9AGAR|nr:hypothetical protein BDP27DRAFT_1418461 [Rhodocollybia butyracea]